MIIISQNGAIDLPYDSCLVWICDKEIMAQPIRKPNNYTFAYYSTQEVAEYAMRLLHKACVRHRDLFQFPKEEYL